MKTKILRTKILWIWTNGDNNENDVDRLEKMFSGNNGKEGINYGELCLYVEISWKRGAVATESNAINISEKKKNVVMEQLWLTYFNDSLLKNGAITNEEHERMRVIIKNRSFRLEQQR